jgi:NADPH2:quinone reductase
MKAIRIAKTGGPEVMQLQDIALPEPGGGEVRVRHRAIGVNFIDTYHRTGLYPVPLPSGLGQEAAGVVEGVGEGVEHLQIGDRVAYGVGPIGAYAEAKNHPAGRLSKIPDSIGDEQAAAMMLKGMTARYLLRETYRVQAGEAVLIHAAAGGVGLILCQWANVLGAMVIGTTGSPQKAELAAAHGCHHVIDYSSEDVVKRVREITGGKGVAVVYDGVGQATLMTSLDCLRPRGLLASYGNASGPVRGLDALWLSQRGSLYLTRPTLLTYVADNRALQENASELFSMVEAGKIKIEVKQRYRLAEAAQAHRDLEGRKTTGASILLP